ncbi:MAG: SRPBCC family protein [Rhizobiales bacterium]|nr:SRPBCC family protein [Hyphomicrobiales bacterium]
MKTVAVTKQIPVAADTAWTIIRTGDKMDRWSPPVTACSLEGSGPGARRVCIISDKQLDEVIETVDDSARVFQYRIVRQDLMPVANVLGTIHIAPVSEQSCQVLWLTNFDMLDEAAWPQVKEGMEGLYSVSIDGLATAAA